MTNYFDEAVKACLQGDSVDTILEKLKSRSSKALKSYSNNTEPVDNLKLELENAVEVLKKAVVNHGEIIQDNASYVENLTEARNKVELLKREIKIEEAKLDFYKNVLGVVKGTHFIDAETGDFKPVVTDTNSN